MSAAPLADPSGPLPAAGRRCFLTVLFSDVSDSSRHAEELEAEDYAALLRSFRQSARDVIPRHGGSIARLQGDGVLALFGVHGTSEDDGRRATQAALELHAAVSRLRVGSHLNSPSLQLHSGIHAGLVLLLEGDIERGRFDVVGEVPNTASRLCSMAQAGDILISKESLGPQEHFFEAAWRRCVAVRGRQSALDVISVSGTSQVRRRIDAAARRGVVPFVGRDAALISLLDAAAAVGAGTAPPVVPVVHVSGEPGVGKTRLLDEFHQRLDSGGFLVVQGYCEASLGAEPLQPFLNGLTVAMHEASNRGLAPEGFGELADALLGNANEGGGQASTADAAAAHAARSKAIVELLELLSSGRPLVLILDDWQWADDASRQVLHQVMGRVSHLLVVLATRSGGLAEDALVDRVQRLELNPLDVAAGKRAILAWLPDADEFLVQEIYRRSGGSPLFLEELCHAALAGGDLAATPQARGVAWIDSLVASRLARLPAELAERLQMASVIGNVVPLQLLRRLFGPGADDTAQRLVEQDFLAPMPQAQALRFRHALTREAVYATVDIAVRRGWHLLVAQTLEAANDDGEAAQALEALAYHYHAAQRSEQTARFAVAAGDKALAAMALDRARAMYVTALQALDALPVLSQQMQLQWCSIAQRLGQTCVFDPIDMNEVAPMFERAVSVAHQAGDINTLARAEYWLAYMNYGRGRPRQAVRYARAALAHAHASGDGRLEAQLQATLAQSLAAAGRYAEALPLLAAAVDSKQRHSRPDSRTAIGSAYCIARRGYSLGDIGRFDEAHAHLKQALDMLGGVEHSLRASILELTCAVHLWQGRWQEAREAGLAGSEVALRCRSRYMTAMGRALSGCAQWALDGDLPAYRALRDATYLIDARGGAVSTSLNFGWLVEAAVTLGLEADLRQHTTGLLQRARQQDRHGHAMGCRALARHRLARGELSAAALHLKNADRSASLRGSTRETALNALAWAEWAQHAGSRPEARARLDDALTAFERMGMRWHLEQAQALAAAF